MTRAAAVQSPDEAAKADFGTKATLASAAAWSPNPQKPPLFLGLPVQDGQAQPQVAGRWRANASLAMVDQHVSNFRKLHALAMDVGTRDTSIAAAPELLDQVLTRYGVRHTFETYDGGHISGVADRLRTKVLPFFSANLSFSRQKATR